MLTEEGKMCVLRPFSCMSQLSGLVIRMGSIPWKGQPLHAGFSTFIAGKEVALDVAISASQLPTMGGQESSSIDTSSVTLDTPKALGDQSSRYFVSPVSFYATKPKVKGPRYPVF